MPSLRELKFSVLRFLDVRGRRNKWNALGSSGQPGDLELYLGTPFDPEVRARAERAWDSLQSADLIRSDYATLVDRGNTVEITDAGQQALERHALDNLDEALMRSSARFVELRDTSWMALANQGEEAGRQAAASMCELVDQLLREMAPAKAVMAAEWYAKVETSRTRVSRFQRARLIMEHYHGRHDENRCRALITAHDELEKIKHTPRSHDRETVEAALRFSEDALRHVLLWPTRDDQPEDSEAEESAK